MECDQCSLEWRWCAWLGWSYTCLAWQLPTGLSHASLGSICSVRYGMKYSKHQIPESERGNAVHAWTCIERNDFSTEVCILHIQLIGTHVWLPKMHRIRPDVDFESSRSPEKEESWNNPNLHWAVFPTWQCSLNPHVWWMYEIKRAKRLSQVFVHFVTARASLFTDHKIAGLPVRAKYRHLRTMCENTVDKSPTVSFSSSLNWWSFMQGVAALYNCWVVLFTSSHYLSTHFFAWPSRSQDQEDIVSASGFPKVLVCSFSLAPAEIQDSNNTSAIIHNILANHTCSLSAA